MKFTLVLLALAICSTLAVDELEWQNFKKTHSKSYKNIAEETHR